MANETIYSNSTNVLSWKSGSVDKTQSQNETTLVTNSSGITVYWTQGGTSGSISSSSVLTCTQGASTKKWDFTEQSGGEVRITLSVTGGGAGRIAATGEGQGQGQGQGKGQGKP